MRMLGVQLTMQNKPLFEKNRGCAYGASHILILGINSTPAVYDALRRKFQCATVQLDFQMPIR